MLMLCYVDVQVRKLLWTILYQLTYNFKDINPNHKVILLFNEFYFLNIQLLQLTFTVLLIVYYFIITFYKVLFEIFKN